MGMVIFLEEARKYIDKEREMRLGVLMMRVEFEFN